jgi:ribonuclease P protein component
VLGASPAAEQAELLPPAGTSSLASCPWAHLVPGRWSEWSDRALRAAEAMGEATVSAEQPASGQAAWVSTPDVDESRPCHPAYAAPKRSRPSVGLIWRIRDRATFASLRGRPRVRRGPISVTFLAAPGPPRVAYAIGRSVGPAVVRNRVRRRLRSIVSRLSLPSGAYLVGVEPGAAGMGFAQLEGAVTEAARAASETAGSTSAGSASAPWATSAATPAGVVPGGARGV